MQCSWILLSKVLVVVHNLNDDQHPPLSVSFQSNDEPPLIVEANRVLAGTLPEQLLESQGFVSNKVLLVLGAGQESNLLPELLDQVRPYLGQSEVGFHIEASEVVILEVNAHKLAF
jgi:hypothetical protein